MWRLTVPMVVAGVGMGVLNAVLGREAIASVPAASAGMGSGANQTARYLGAACGITLFVTVATHAGNTIIEGWNIAVLVSATLTLMGAAAIALTGARRALTRLNPTSVERRAAPVLDYPRRNARPPLSAAFLGATAIRPGTL